MRSLQVKFSALVVMLLVAACVSLALVATQHERGALEDEIEKRARTLVRNLAGAAKDPLLEVEQGKFDDELTLDRLIEEVGMSGGVVGARLLGRDRVNRDVFLRGRHAVVAGRLADDLPTGRYLPCAAPDTEVR